MKRLQPEIIVIEDSDDEDQQKIATNTAVENGVTLLPEQSLAKRVHLDPYEELEQRAYDLLRNRFKLQEFRFPQLEVIMSIHEGLDTIALLPTGFGKSLLYQLGSLLAQENQLTLVISPLIALMLDQHISLEARGVPCAVISSAMTQTKVAKLCKDLRSSPVTPHKLLYISPERLDSAEFRTTLTFLTQHNRISAVAIDEAHCISQWGGDFRKAYSRIGRIRTLIPRVPFLAVTATATNQVKSDIIQSLQMRSPNFYPASLNRPEITYCVRPAAVAVQEITDLIKQLPVGTDCIVYCFSKSNCESMAKSIRKLGQPAVTYHSGLKMSERTQITRDWQEEKLHIVCATTAFGMGIDKPCVRLVLHQIPPLSIEHLYQESGRGGRDGKLALNIVFYSKRSMEMLRGWTEKTSNFPEKKLDALDKVSEYCQLKTCRRAYLIQFFNQTFNSTNSSASCCDVCNPGVIESFAQRVMELGEK